MLPYECIPQESVPDWKTIASHLETELWFALIFIFYAFYSPALKV